MGNGVKGECKNGNGSVLFYGELILSGRGNPEVNDVRVRLLDEDNDTLKLVPIGDISAIHRENFVVKLNQSPELVVIDTGSIGTEGTTEWAFIGLKQVTGGVYKQVVINQSDNPVR